MSQTRSSSEIHSHLASRWHTLPAARNRTLRHPACTPSSMLCSLGRTASLPPLSASRLAGAGSMAAAGVTWCPYQYPNLPSCSLPFSAAAATCLPMEIALLVQPWTLVRTAINQMVRMAVKILFRTGAKPLFTMAAKDSSPKMFCQLQISMAAATVSAGLTAGRMTKSITLEPSLCWQQSAERAIGEDADAAAKANTPQIPLNRAIPGHREAITGRTCRQPWTGRRAEAQGCRTPSWPRLPRRSFSSPASQRRAPRRERTVCGLRQRTEGGSSSGHATRARARRRGPTPTPATTQGLSPGRGRLTEVATETMTFPLPRCHRPRSVPGIRIMISAS
mmetsp:Transcript_74327/g.198545  ORF Transcript_74327/g.198545 Transcript_74327/m.198545 type:complete len:335 (+) Transcript_74327:1876-2880(+)